MPSYLNGVWCELAEKLMLIVFTTAFLCWVFFVFDLLHLDTIGDLSVCSV